MEIEDQDWKREVNFCKKGTMSTCTAMDEGEQNWCEFFERSSLKNKCMYFIFDEYCGCFKAQKKAKER